MARTTRITRESHNEIINSLTTAQTQAASAENMIKLLTDQCENDQEKLKTLVTDPMFTISRTALTLAKEAVNEHSAARDRFMARALESLEVSTRKEIETLILSYLPEK